MGTWELYGPSFCPESYRKLLLRTRILFQENPNANRCTAIRYTLRRLTFTDEQTEAYVRAVDRCVHEGEDIELLDAMVEELGSPVEGTTPRASSPVVRVPVRVDPWSAQRLLRRRAVLQHRLGRPVSRSEAFRRIFRRRQFTDEQERAFGDEVLERIRREEPELYVELVDEAEPVSA